MSSIAPAKRAAITSWFEENFRARGELGASVSIWIDGVEVLSLNQGFCDRARTRPWTVDTLVPIWSATKGPAAVSCLLALSEGVLDLNCPVAQVWPEFAGGGKQDIRLSHILSHTAGLCALDEPASILDYEEVIDALEQQRPLWEPGSRQGYHARTFGFLVDEIVRRVAGADSLGTYFREMIGAPLDLDLWIGLPQEQWGRVSPVYPGKINPANQDQPFLKAFNTPGSLTRRTFTSPVGLNAVSDVNQPDLWARGLASMGGVASAHGLGKFYAVLAQNGQWGGEQIVSNHLVRQLSYALSQEDDAVLCTPIAFAAGVMQDPLDPARKKLRSHFGSSLTAFGHPGAGGSLAFADPENGIAFAYVMNQMEVGALPSEKAIGLVERLYE
ncbi:MAG: serine hydrolase domain-containing protein [Prosthecobacter sp.]|nr:serine hydrolase domain-containing protein [Prosthecobacter sp.]